jgi:4-hydroxymandelate oxidase
MPLDRSDAARRRFLQWLAAAPVATIGAVIGGPTALQAIAQIASPPLVRSATDALNVFELEAVARQAVPPAHWGYLNGGVLGDRTVESNRAAYDRWGFRARRLVDVSRIDISTTLFGEKWNSPIALSPVSSQRAFHTGGEQAVASAAKGRNALQILSTLTTFSIEDVMKARGGPVWQQLYPTNRSEVGEKVAARAEAAGAGAIVFTVDLAGGGQRRETQSLGERLDTRTCTTCHDRSRGYDFARKRMFDGLDMTGVVAPTNATLTWDYLGRLRDKVKTKLLVKGIMSAEDADLAIRRGVDGIVVSNHGGRAEESLIGTLDVLPSIAQAVSRRVPILIDGGIRRGVDAFKALALGADMVCVGRPYVWGLGAFGEEGVAAAMKLLDDELISTMRQAGVTSLAGITRDSVVALR